MFAVAIIRLRLIDARIEQQSAGQFYTASAWIPVSLFVGSSQRAMVFALIQDLNHI